MIGYLVESGLVMTVLFALYFLLLRKETQYQIRRIFLLTITILCLVVPLIRIPISPELTRYSAMIILPAINVGNVVLQEATLNILGFAIQLSRLPILIYSIVSGIFLLILIYSVTRIVRYYIQSKPLLYENVLIRIQPDIPGSCNFFNIIFANAPNPYMVKHEEAHARQLHSFDLALLQICRSILWWTPASWLIIREMKLIHEFQADAYATQNKDIEEYRRLLISTSMASVGMSLASSFHHSAIVKRLNEMKKETQKIRRWKINVLGTMMAVIVFISCTDLGIGDGENKLSFEYPESKSNEILKDVDRMPEFPGGVPNLYQFIGNNLKYPDQARRMGIEGRVFVEFIVNKSGKVTLVKTVKGIGAGCDDAAANVISSLPDFNPGLENGERVNVRMIVPIIFKLNNDKENNLVEVEN